MVPIPCLWRRGCNHIFRGVDLVGESDVGLDGWCVTQGIRPEITTRVDTLQSAWFS